MQKKTRICLDLFWESFTLSAFTFGGGYVIVPLMRKRFVEKKRWISDDEMLDMVAIAQSAPGVIAVNTAIIAGYRLAGVLGALTAALATVLPPLITISVIAAFYDAFRNNEIVAAAMRAMQAAVAAVIVDAVFKMGASTLKDKRLSTPAIMALCFAASYFFNVNVAVIILTCGALGAVNTLIAARKAKEGGPV